MYRAAEDLVDVYQQMVFDMVDHCKTDEAINECKAENNEVCQKQVRCSESKLLEFQSILTMNTLEKINSEKGYHCECMDGFAKKTPDGPCEDINECETGEANCASRSEEGLVCKNLIGYQNQLDDGTQLGYTCLCKDGYYERSLSFER